MKKLFLFVSIIALSMSALFSSPVDPATAKRLAETFWSQKCPTRAQADFRSVSAEIGFQNIYIFNNQNGDGFVILSADDCAIPVLGYSDNSTMPVGELPANLRSWLGYYEGTIAAAVAHNAVADESVARQWTNLRAGRLPVEETRDAVSPMLTTKWDQDAPYNNLCPGGSYTGCAATAMAQVMKYHNWPTTGTGSHTYSSTFGSYTYSNLTANFGTTTYDWSHMNNTYTSYSTGTSATAVATLMYHCGVAIEMAYSPEGSGAYIADLYNYGAGSHASVEYALKTYFSYKSTIHAVWKDNYSTDTQWANMLKTELNAGRPVVYSGYDSDNSSGHAFVCDGYNSSDQFHFNWGWSGYADGYFAVSSLTPSPGGIGGGSYDFSYTQHAVIGIEPTNGTGGGTETSAYDIKLYADMTITPTPLQKNESMSVTTTIANYGDNAFSGSLKLSLLTSTGTEAQILQQGDLNGTLNSLSGANITMGGDVTVSAGTYKVALYYKGSDESAWTLVSDDLGHANPVTVTVTEPAASSANLQMFNNFTINPSPMVKGSNVNVTVSVYNQGSGDFSGAMKLALLNSSSQEVQVIQQKNYSISATSSDICTFTGTVTVNAGSYKLALYYKPSTATSWTLVGTNLVSNSNPKNVSVVTPSGISDICSTQVEITPNPAKDVIRISAPTLHIDRVDIFNMMGEKVLSKSGMTSGTTLNISSLSAGVYLLRLTTADGVSTRKIVKQ